MLCSLPPRSPGTCALPTGQACCSRAIRIALCSACRSPHYRDYLMSTPVPPSALQRQSRLSTPVTQYSSTPVTEYSSTPVTVCSAPAAAGLQLGGLCSDKQGRVAVVEPFVARHWSTLATAAAQCHAIMTARAHVETPQRCGPVIPRQFRLCIAVKAIEYPRARGTCCNYSRIAAARRRGAKQPCQMASPSR